MVIYKNLNKKKKGRERFNLIFIVQINVLSSEIYTDAVPGI